MQYQGRNVSVYSSMLPAPGRQQFPFLLYYQPVFFLGLYGGRYLQTFALLQFIIVGTTFQNFFNNYFDCYIESGCCNYLSFYLVQFLDGIFMKKNSYKHNYCCNSEDSTNNPLQNILICI